MADVIEPERIDFQHGSIEGLAPAASTPASASSSVVVLAAVWQQIRTHAAHRLDVEVGGVLLGMPCVDAEGRRHVRIDGHVPALAAPSSGSSVTFTAEAWIDIHATIDRERPDARIVGWYHTHPRFGIFLSPMDVFIHRHFFAMPFQLAIVIDPIADESGAFVWTAGELVRQPVAIESPPCRSSPTQGRHKLSPNRCWRLLRDIWRRPQRRG